MKFRLIALTIILSVFTIPAYAQQTKNKSRLSLEISVSRAHFPGSLFELDKSITKHPDSLSGTGEEIGLSYHISKWSVGGSFINIQTQGNGDWAREGIEEEFKQEDVTGIVTGKTTMKVKGFIVHGKRSFLDGPLKPYFRIGLGPGWSKIKFKGKFIGHETESGYDFPIVEPAEDNITRIIPLLSFEVGTDLKFNNRITLFPAFNWNTGNFGLKGGIRINF